MNDAFVLHALLSQMSFQGHNEAPREPSALVLAVVVATQESTYQKPGSVALIDAQSGQVFGLVSGGCLEGDLLARVQQLWMTTQGRNVSAALPPAVSDPSTDVWMPVRYDTRHEADDFLGTALGCRGCLDIALLPLWSPSGQELARLVCEAWSPQSSFFGKVTLEERPDSKVSLQFGLIASPQAGLHADCINDSEKHSSSASIAFLSEDALARTYLSSGAQALSFALPKRHRLLICGAGADVRPLVVCALELGFEVSVYDHRPDARQALQASLASADTSKSQRHDFSAFLPAIRDSRDLAHADLHRVAGVLVMTHNLMKDAWCMDVLADRGIDPERIYLGLLGPERRRHEVFKHARRRKGPHGSQHPLDHPLLKSPMGMDLGGRGPAEIAIEVLADLVRSIRLPRFSERSA